MNTSITAIIPAAGLGTRALPNSKAAPKELVALWDKPAIQWVVEEALNAGIQKIVIVTGPGKEAIETYFSHSEAFESAVVNKPSLLATLRHVIELGKKITYVTQHEPLGLGHAVLQAAPVVDGPFIVVTPDDMWVPSSNVIEQMIQRLGDEVGDKGIIAVREVPRAEIGSYGCPDGKAVDDGDPSFVHVDKIVEKPSPENAPSTLAVSGRWLLPRRTFDILAETKPGAGGEIQLTDSLDVLAAEGNLFALTFGDGQYVDIGNPKGLGEAWMRFGIDIHEFSSVVSKVVF